VGPAVLTTEWIGDVWMIEEVEEFGAELGAETFVESPCLRDGEIPVTKTSVAEYVSPHGAKRTESRRQHQRAAIRIAAESSERSAV